MYINIKEIEAHELAAWLENKADEFKIIDVREMNEINAGTIQGANPMPLATVPLKLAELDKDKTLVMICRSGARSGQACAYLLQQGFDNVVNLRGGMFSWASSGGSIGLPQAC